MVHTFCNKKVIKIIHVHDFKVNCTRSETEGDLQQHIICAIKNNLYSSKQTMVNKSKSRYNFEENNLQQVDYQLQTVLQGLYDWYVVLRSLIRLLQTVWYVHVPESAGDYGLIVLYDRLGRASVAHPQLWSEGLCSVFLLRWETTVYMVTLNHLCLGDIFFSIDQMI